MNTFQKNFSDLLDKHNLDSATIGELCGTNGAEIESYLNGEKTPDPGIVEQIEAILEIPSGSLLDNSEDEPRAEEVSQAENVLPFTSPHSERVIEFLRDRGPSLPREIRNGTGIGNNVHKVLAALVRREIVEAHGRARSQHVRYSLREAAKKTREAPKEAPKSSASDFLRQLVRSFGEEHKVSILVDLADNTEFIDGVMGIISYAASRTKKEIVPKKVTIEDVPLHVKQQIIDEWRELALNLYREK